MKVMKCEYSNFGMKVLVPWGKLLDFKGYFHEFL